MATRRSRGDGNIRQRPDGRWESRIPLPDGRRKSIYAKTQKEARSKLRAAQKQMESGLDITANTITVESYLSEWLADVKPGLRPTTHESYASYVRTHLVPSLGRLKLSELKASHVNSMLRGMADRGLSPRTQNLARATLRKALNDAMDADLIPSNAAAKARAAKQQAVQIVLLTPEEVRVLLSHTRDHRSGPLIHVAIGTGMRQAELLGLRWADLNLDDASINVRHTIQRVDGVMAFAATKTDKSRRTIALDQTTVQALLTQKKMVEDLWALAGNKWAEWDLVFPSAIGTPLNNSNVTHQFQKLLEAAGLPRQRFHDLRHCTASLIASQGGNLKAIQEALGHSQISFTANIYTHFYDEMRRDTANRIGSALMGSENS